MRTDKVRSIGGVEDHMIRSDRFLIHVRTELIMLLILFSLKPH